MDKLENVVRTALDPLSVALAEVDQLRLENQRIRNENTELRLKAALADQSRNAAVQALAAAFGIQNND